MDEPRLNFFTRIYYSMAGFKNYRYFLRQSVGKAVVYLLLLALIIGIATYIPTINTYNKVVDDIIKGFDTSVPDFTFSNGELKVKGQMPIIIGKDTSTIIIDTSDSPNESILNDYDNAILFTKDKMIQKTFVNRRVTDLSALKGVELTKQSVKEALPVMKPIGVFVIILGSIFFIGAKFIDALIVSLIALIVNSVKRTNLTYSSIFRISIFSMTLPLIVCTLLGLLFHLPLMWLLFYVISAVYVYGAINSIRKELDSFNDQFPVQ